MVFFIFLIMFEQCKKIGNLVDFIILYNVLGGIIIDQQLKKGFLEHIVLATLKKEDSYGYKLIQDIKILIDIPKSTLYPILKRLEVNQYVQTYTVEFNSRLRKYYQITKLGIKELENVQSDYQEIKKMIAYITGKKYEKI